MIPTNKLKKLVLECIIRLMDSVTTQDIWDGCANEIFQTTEQRLNSLQVKEIFYKEILPDLSYNNFGNDNKTVEKLKNLKWTLNNNDSNDGASSINWIEVDRALDEPDNTVEMKMACLHSENLDENTEEQSILTDNENDGDNSINELLVKYDIPGQVRAVQDPFISQESEQIFSFRESQLINVFGAVESDPLAMKSNEEIPKEGNSYDSYDSLCDGGRLLDYTEVSNHIKTSVACVSFESTEHLLKRKYSSLTNVNLTTDFDQDNTEVSLTKRRRSNSLQAFQFSLLSDSGESVELASIVQRLDESSHENNENVMADSSNKSQDNNNFSKETSNIDNNENKKSTDEIVAKIQMRINNAVKNGEEILTILLENEEYISMLEIPSFLPKSPINDEPRNREEKKNDSQKSIENTESISQPKVKPARTKYARALQIYGPKLTYESSQGSDPTNTEETLNPLLLNDTVLSGSHKDCIGEVKEITLISSSQSLSSSHGSQSSKSRGLQFSKSGSQLSTCCISQSQNNSAQLQQSPEKTELCSKGHEDEVIKNIQALLDAAKSSEEINRIIDENYEFCDYLVIPFHEPDDNISQITSHEPNEKAAKSKDEIIAEIQKQLDAALDQNTIEKILDENEEYSEYLTVPFFMPPLSHEAQPIPKNCTKKVMQKTRNEGKQVKTENNIPETDNLERSSSRTELSFLLMQNVNIKKRRAVSQPKKLEENLIIDLVDDSD
ncbi:unnamed protein product [Chironomus riparius]|uniref:Uncharacterized protein n=1 Tax=Chironomus riparius TaxID=315576 RepID=A0A9P0J4U1_9DIPT|nr:unnamed protein product [Chironomus riparius]